MEDQNINGNPDLIGSANDLAGQNDEASSIAEYFKDIKFKNEQPALSYLTEDENEGSIDIDSNSEASSIKNYFRDIREDRLHKKAVQNVENNPIVSQINQEAENIAREKRNENVGWWGRAGLRTWQIAKARFHDAMALVNPLSWKDIPDMELWGGIDKLDISPKKVKEEKENLLKTKYANLVADIPDREIDIILNGTDTHEQLKLAIKEKNDLQRDIAKDSGIWDQFNGYNYYTKDGVPVVNLNPAKDQVWSIKHGWAKGLRQTFLKDGKDHKTAYDLLGREDMDMPIEEVMKFKQHPAITEDTPLATREYLNAYLKDIQNDAAKKDILGLAGANNLAKTTDIYAGAYDNIYQSLEKDYGDIQNVPVQDQRLQTLLKIGDKYQTNIERYKNNSEEFKLATLFGENLDAMQRDLDERLKSRSKNQRRARNIGKFVASVLPEVANAIPEVIDVAGVTFDSLADTEIFTNRVISESYNEEDVKSSAESAKYFAKYYVDPETGNMIEYDAKTGEMITVRDKDGYELYLEDDELEYYEEVNSKYSNGERAGLIKDRKWGKAALASDTAESLMDQVVMFLYAGRAKQAIKQGGKAIAKQRVKSGLLGKALRGGKKLKKGLNAYTPKRVSKLLSNTMTAVPGMAAAYSHDIMKGAIQEGGLFDAGEIAKATMLKLGMESVIEAAIPIEFVQVFDNWFKGLNRTEIRKFIALANEESLPKGTATALGYMREKGLNLLGMGIDESLEEMAAAVLEPAVVNDYLNAKFESSFDEGVNSEDIFDGALMGGLVGLILGGGTVTATSLADRNREDRLTARAIKNVLQNPNVVKDLIVNAKGYSQEKIDKTLKIYEAAQKRSEKVFTGDYLPSEEFQTAYANSVFELEMNRDRLESLEQGLAEGRKLTPKESQSLLGIRHYESHLEELDLLLDSQIDLPATLSSMMDFYSRSSKNSKIYNKLMDQRKTLRDVEIEGKTIKPGIKKPLFETYTEAVNEVKDLKINDSKKMHQVRTKMLLEFEKLNHQLKPTDKSKEKIEALEKDLEIVTKENKEESDSKSKVQKVGETLKKKYEDYKFKRAKRKAESKKKSKEKSEQEQENSEPQNIDQNDLYNNLTTKYDPDNFSDNPDAADIVNNAIKRIESNKDNPEELAKIEQETDKLLSELTQDPKEDIDPDDKDDGEDPLENKGLASSLGLGSTRDGEDDGGGNNPPPDDPDENKDDPDDEDPEDNEDENDLNDDEDENDEENPSNRVRSDDKKDENPEDNVAYASRKNIDVVNSVVELEDGSTKTTTKAVGVTYDDSNVTTQDDKYDNRKNLNPRTTQNQDGSYKTVTFHATDIQDLIHSEDRSNPELWLKIGEFDSISVGKETIEVDPGGRVFIPDVFKALAKVHGVNGVKLDTEIMPTPGLGKDAPMIRVSDIIPIEVRTSEDSLGFYHSTTWFRGNKAIGETGSLIERYLEFQTKRKILLDKMQEAAENGKPVSTKIKEVYHASTLEKSVTYLTDSEIKLGKGLLKNFPNISLKIGDSYLIHQDGEYQLVEDVNIESDGKVSSSATGASILGESRMEDGEIYYDQWSVGSNTIITNPKAENTIRYMIRYYLGKMNENEKQEFEKFAAAVLEATSKNGAKGINLLNDNDKENQFNNYLKYFTNPKTSSDEESFNEETTAIRFGTFKNGRPSVKIYESKNGALKPKIYSRPAKIDPKLGKIYQSVGFQGMLNDTDIVYITDFTNGEFETSSYREYFQENFFTNIEPIETTGSTTNQKYSLRYHPHISLDMSFVESETKTSVKSKGDSTPDADKNNKKDSKQNNDPFDPDRKGNNSLSFTGDDPNANLTSGPNIDPDADFEQQGGETIFLGEDTSDTLSIEDIKEGYRFSMNGQEVEIIPNQDGDGENIVRVRKVGSEKGVGKPLKKQTILDNMNAGKYSPISSTKESTTQSVKQQKADINRKREEDKESLKDVDSYVWSFDGGSQFGNVWFYGKDHGQGEFSLNKDGSVTPMREGSIQSSIFTEEQLRETVGSKDIKVINQLAKEVDAKYDAEIAALENQTQSVEQQEAKKEKALDSFGNKLELSGNEIIYKVDGSTYSEFDTAEEAEKAFKELQDQSKKKTTNQPTRKKSIKTSEIENSKNRIKETQKSVNQDKRATDTRGFYEIDGIDYIRNSNIMPNEFDKDSSKYQNSTVAGNTVDDIVRDFFQDFPYIKDYAVYKDRISESAYESLKSQLVEIQRDLDSKGRIFLTDETVLFSKKYGVAGTVDIIAIDSEGNYHLYDIKTAKRNFRNYDKRYGNNKLSKKDGHRNQLSAYNLMFKEMMGVEFKSLNILGFGVDIDQKGYISGIKDRKKFSFKANPNIENRFISYQVLEERKRSLTKNESKEYARIAKEKAIFAGKDGRPLSNKINSLIKTLDKMLDENPNSKPIELLRDELSFIRGAEFVEQNASDPVEDDINMKGSREAVDKAPPTINGETNNQGPGGKPTSSSAKSFMKRLKNKKNPCNKK